MREWKGAPNIVLKCKLIDGQHNHHLSQSPGTLQAASCKFKWEPKASTPPPARCSITSYVKYSVSMREAAEALGCDGVRPRRLLRLSI